jgi:hypothetical protein
MIRLDSGFKWEIFERNQCGKKGNLKSRLCVEETWEMVLDKSRIHVFKKIKEAKLESAVRFHPKAG